MKHEEGLLAGLSSQGTETVGTPLVHYGPIWESGLENIRTEQPAPVAVLVCHGMGQQVRYETISSIAEAIRTEVTNRGGVPAPVQVHLTQANDDFLARAEVNWTDKDHRKHDVHVYEAYWAPLTEGRVTYWDTVKFLLGAAWGGLRCSKLFRKSSFRRWMFDEPKVMMIGSNTKVGLLGVLLFLLLQVGFIAYASIESTHWVKNLSTVKLPTFESGAGAWLQFLASLLPAGGSALFDPAHLGDATWFRALARLILWLLVIAEAFVVRYFLVQYVGDVAAYISPYKDSKFYDLRHQIQKIGFNVGKAVYGFDSNTGTVPNYSKVVVVGHSLGSVLAYDTLDGLISLDNLSQPPDSKHVVERTRALITFGSPLDKTAFLFRMQASKPADWIREQLAASSQPLIVSYRLYRPHSFKWVNIWSPQDIISSKLDYYDDPELDPGDPRRIENLLDVDARTPLAAHVQYWNNEMLRKQLYLYVS